MSGRYDMNSDPSTWPGPDDVDIIQAQERFEATDDFVEAALEWATNDDDCIGYICDRFVAVAHGPYDAAFGRWMERGGQ